MFAGGLPAPAPRLGGTVPDQKAKPFDAGVYFVNSKSKRSFDRPPQTISGGVNGWLFVFVWLELANEGTIWFSTIKLPNYKLTM